MSKSQPHTKKTRKKISEAHKKKKHSNEKKRKIKSAMKKLWRTKDWTERNKNLSKSLKGHKHSKKTKRKISKSLKGHKYNLGHKHSKETKKKISNSNKGKTKGEKCHFWKGGISFEPYSVNWTETLRKSIRQRDKYTCQICEKEPAVQVHHIDYDKKNSNPNNLVTLCKSCHSKTNTNREYWIKYFQLK